MKCFVYDTRLMENDDDFTDATEVDSFEGTEEECNAWFNENYDINDYILSFTDRG